MEPLDYINRIRANKGTPDHVAADFEALAALVKSGEFRDFAFSAQLYAGLFQLLSLACSWRTEESQPYVVKVQQIFWSMVRAPEFDVAEAEEQVGPQLCWSLASRTDGSAQQAEWPFIRDILLWLYDKFPSRRHDLRRVIGKPLKAAARLPHKSAPVAPLLQVLGPIIRGFQQPLGEVQRKLLIETLIPLHKTNAWLLWDRQTPMISMYHKELVHCMLLMLEKEPALASHCIEAVCSHLPPSHESNTPKEVLLIAEIAEMLKVLDPVDAKECMPQLQRQILRLLTSHNGQTLQSVLQFWKDERVCKLLGNFAADLIPGMLPLLLRDGEVFWNPTVNKMTCLVLEKLEAANPEVFELHAEKLWGPGKGVPAFEVVKAPEPPPVEETKRPSPPPPNLTSLRFGAGDWKPGQSSGGGKQPPLTTTGVAPWAFKGGAGNGSMKQPPVTVTGVAPWAFKKDAAPQPPPPPVLSSLQETAEDEEKPPPSGLDRVHKYMKLLLPAAPEEGPSSWEAALMEETPTLLPTLKFHNLVYGSEDIGQGAFSVVRYARAIQQDRTQSQWPEYAVKVISTKTVEELGYEASVNREICVLKMLSHPGIARMVAAFRYRDGAYLVLEYAQKGDLHNILVGAGKLDEEVVRFFCGEVVAALCAIHDIGFMYGDLKPENVVITSSNHAKLTDFGGCRPMTDEAALRCRRALLKRLRDGDWQAQDAPEADGLLPECEEELLPEDSRVEGTMLYLPPEVVHGAMPSLASDAWALGCLVYQLLTGRPPIWAESETEEEIRRCIISFKLDDGGLTDKLSQPAQLIVRALLEADLSKRLPIEGAAKHGFFEGLDVFTLYRRPRGPELPEIQRKSPQDSNGDERWNRRKFSMIWTVMPSAQDFVPPKTFGVESTATRIQETDAECRAPFGGEDSDKVVPSHRVESL